MSIFRFLIPASPILAILTAARDCFHGRASLQIEVLGLHHQLNVLERSVKRPKLTASDRFFWAFLAATWRSWRSALIIVQTGDGYRLAPDSQTEPSESSSQIDCFKNMKLCIVASAEKVFGDLEATIAYYDVTEWTDDGIIAKNDEGICVVNRIRINFQDRSVLEIDSPKLGAKGVPFSDGTNGCDLLNKTQTYQLVDLFSKER